jgi:hypothetical protein
VCSDVIALADLLSGRAWRSPVAWSAPDAALARETRASSDVSALFTRIMDGRSPPGCVGGKAQLQGAMKPAPTDRRPPVPVWLPLPLVPDHLRPDGLASFLRARFIAPPIPPPAASSRMDRLALGRHDGSQRRPFPAGMRWRQGPAPGRDEARPDGPKATGRPCPLRTGTICCCASCQRFGHATTFPARLVSGTLKEAACTRR